MKLQFGSPHPVGPGRRRIFPFLCSLGLHAGGVALALFGPELPRGNEEMRMVVRVVPADTIRPRQTIIWHDLRRRLPAVDPAAAPKPARPAIRTPHPQQIVTQSAPAPRKQFTWLPAPKVELRQELETPNFLAFQRIEQPAPPPRPKPRALTPLPAPRTPPPQNRAEFEPPPQLALQQAPASLAAASPFGAHEPAPPARPEAPVPPAPPPGSTSTSAASSGAGDLQAAGAVVSLAPANRNEIVMPDSSAAAGLAAGPKLSQGDATLPSSGGAAVVPGLAVAAVRGGPPPELDPTARPEPARRSTVPAMPTPPASASISVPLWPQARRIPPLIEDRFPGRPVYASVSAPPSGLGMSGDWTIWFGERNSAPSRASMRPPVPGKMAGPAPAAHSEVGVGAKLFLSGVISAEGRLSSLAVLSGPAAVAELLIPGLEGWQFAPARRGGMAVDVDVVLEVPVTAAVRAEK